MTYAESDIVHEGARHWVLRRPGKRGWFEVLEIRATHSVVVGTFHFPNEPDRSRDMAIADCKRRDA